MTGPSEQWGTNRQIPNTVELPIVAFSLLNHGAMLAVPSAERIIAQYNADPNADIVGPVIPPEVRFDLIVVQNAAPIPHWYTRHLLGGNLTLHQGVEIVVQDIINNGQRDECLELIDLLWVAATCIVTGFPNSLALLPALLQSVQADGDLIRHQLDIIAYKLPGLHPQDQRSLLDFRYPPPSPT